MVRKHVDAKFLPKRSQSLRIRTHFLCQLLNINECLRIENQDQFTLTLWIPSIHNVRYFVCVPVTRNYEITDPMGEIVSSELKRRTIVRNEILFQVIFN